MAIRPIFIPSTESEGLVGVRFFDVRWAGGFALVQKQKNILSLHSLAEQEGYWPILEVSTKSPEKVGRHLSAFNLKINYGGSDLSLESVFQGSKIFEYGGPYNDLYKCEAKEARKDERIRSSGKIVSFSFDNYIFPTDPMSVFYDWIYIKSLLPYKNWLLKRLDGDVVYSAFSDIEFNPEKSINCQARSCALFIALERIGTLDYLMKDPCKFVQYMKEFRKPEEYFRRPGKFL